MRIVFFTNTYLPINYGSVTSVENFRRGLEELGHEVFIVTPRFKGYEDKNERVYRWPAVMYGYKIKYPMAIPVHLKIEKYLSKIKPDIIHCHQPFSVGCRGLGLGKKFGAPAVFTHHCRYENYVHYIPKFLLRDVFEWFVKRRATNFANNCQQVIAPSESIKQLIRSRGVKQQIEVIPTGIDKGRFGEGNRNETRNKYSIGEKELVILTVGRIDQEKNIELLIKSVIPILKERGDVKMMFVGEGSQVAMIEELTKRAGVEERVILTGLVEQNKVQHYYACADIYVQASVTETQGMTIPEAMATGLPIVAVSAPGAVDQIENGKTGILTEHDSKDFTNNIKRLVEDVQLRTELGNSAKHEMGIAEYQAQARRIEKVYMSLRNPKP